MDHLQSQSGPGIMIVHPRLHSPSARTSEVFFNWTRLHFRDLLSTKYFPHVGSASHAPKVTKQCRFAAPLSEPASGYSHTDRSLQPPYFYTTTMQDISIVRTAPYVNLSRALDLENTRTLAEDEAPVSSGLGDQAMVFDVVSAEFSVLREVLGPGSEPPKPPSLNSNVQSFQNLPIPPVPAAGPGNTHLLAVTITPSVLPGLEAEGAFQAQHHLLSSLGELVGVKLFSSVYAYAGGSAQPVDHPEIGGAVSAWMILTLVAGDATREEVENKAVGILSTKKQVEHFSWGVWDGELFMD